MNKLMFFVENVTKCCLAAGTNTLITPHVVRRQERLQLAVFWQIVSLEVVYVAARMVCRAPGLSCSNIHSSFNLTMRRGMTHGL